MDLLKYHDNICLRAADGSTLTYAEVNALAEKYSTFFRSGPGMLILSCRNDVSTIIAYLGAWRAGCPIMFVDSDRDDNLLQMVAAFEPRYLQRAGHDAPTVNEAAQAAVHPDLAILLSTSGSTGAAKAVRLSRDNITSNASAIAEYLKLDSEDCAALILPLYYSYGLSVLNSHLAAGASVWLADISITNPAFWNRFIEMGCTNFPGVPHVYQTLRRTGFDSGNLPKLRHATQAGGHLSADLVQDFGKMAQRDGWKFYVM